MATVKATPLKARDNASILNAIRRDASLDYQRRIPPADKAAIAQTMEALNDPMNRPLFNEFMDVLVNRIGLVIARNNSWTNPLAEFKTGMLNYGSHIEEIQTGLLKAHTYDPDREQMEATLFGTEKPDVQTNFHTINRQDFYRITINDALLHRAFLEEEGLANFVSQMMSAPSTSDNWDEFLLTCSLFAEYESNGGFHHVHVPDVKTLTSGADEAKDTLRTMRALSKNVQFISTKYNAAHMPVSARPEDLMIFCTPEFEAAIDVEALAGAFNIERANMYGRIVSIPEDNFGVDGAQAILTTKDFFVIADALMQNTSQYNPGTLATNYFLHHHQVVSASRFVPAIMLTSKAGDETPIEIRPIEDVSPITILDSTGEDDTKVERGENVQFTAYAAAEDGEPATMDAVAWSVTGSENPKTFITSYGVLHVAADEQADSVTVRATSVGIDPDNPTSAPVSATITVPITGERAVLWPRPHTHEG